MYSSYSQYPGSTPCGGMGYEYHTSSTTPPPPGYGYYSPRYNVYTTSPPKTSAKQHTRRATQDYSYPSARTTSYHYPDSYNYSGYTRKPEYVSPNERYTRQGKTESGARRASTTYVYSDGRYYAYVTEDEIPPAYSRDPRKHTPPPQYSEADEHPYYQYHQSTPQPRPEPQSRRRATSYSTPKQSAPRDPPPKPRQQQAPPPKRATATDRDARTAGIPAGYNFKNWDPNEEPILLLGSVFDANSLGKWIYDWTVAFHGPSTPITEMAGDLWLSLIQLAGKIKRAEECLPRIRRRDDRELIDDFLDSGERLWERFNKLLKVCEKHMLKTAKRDRGSEKLYMGNNSGREFVETIFGRDRELERTEKLMTGVRLWGMRFDANCEEVLRSSR
ncbi:hypothetical protein D6D13_04202 [Aureobasidium pullulans]|uniref:Vegetative cell wall protein gp1 n=1 Tax=Aureobasidium pullulans TaxID=5580 RepID=A0A4S9CXB5_AURPU|nr:hypothetical protein D6D13_04202 [Aureobasidium pullulans]